MVRTSRKLIVIVVFALFSLMLMEIYATINKNILDLTIKIRDLQGIIEQSSQSWKDEKLSKIESPTECKKEDIPKQPEKISYNKTNRHGFPQSNPKVCLAFLSCRRYDLLLKSILSVVEHIELYEKELSYEIAIMDNCAQDNTLLDDIISRIPVEKFFISFVHYGLPYGLNNLFFSLCTAPYILSMEDDWVWEESRSKKRPLITQATEVLDEQPDDLLGVAFRQSYSKNQGPFWSKTKTSFFYLFILFSNSEDVEWNYCTGPDFLMYIYANAGVLMSKKHLERIGPHTISEGIQSETSYKVRANELGLKSAILKLSTDEECAKWFYEEGRYPLTDCHSAVLHTGGGRHVTIEQKFQS